MALDLKNLKLSQAQKDSAEKTLRNWAELNKTIAKQSLADVRVLLAYELSTRARLTVVQRLTARYGVLEQRENEKEVAEVLAKKFAKER